MNKIWVAARFSTCLIIWALEPDPGHTAARWAHTIGGGSGDEIRSVQQTSGGGYILAGRTLSFGAGSYDAWCLKIDATGCAVWQETYGGSATDDAMAVQSTLDGGYVLAGYTQSFGAGSADAWCLKLDASGGVVWQRTYGGSAMDGASAVRPTPDGGFLLVGSTDSFGAGGTDAWCIKLNASGGVSWQKTYGGSRAHSFAATRSTTDGGYVVAGSTSSFGPGQTDGGTATLRVEATGTAALNYQWYAGTSGDTSQPAPGAAASEIYPTPALAASASYWVRITNGCGSMDSDTATVTVAAGAAPRIDSLRSKTSKPGGKATLIGAGFSKTEAQDVVYFGSQKAKVQKATNNKITVKIPTGNLRAGQIVNVTVTVNGVTSNSVPFQVK